MPTAVQWKLRFIRFSTFAKFIQHVGHSLGATYFALP